MKIERRISIIVTFSLVMFVMTSVVHARLPGFLFQRDRFVEDRSEDVEDGQQNKTKPTEQYYIRSRLNDLVIRQKCQEWYTWGLASLPSFCWQYLGTLQAFRSEDLLEDFVDEQTRNKPAQYRFINTPLVHLILRQNTIKPSTSDYEHNAAFFPLIILRQKCQQWSEDGVTPLPSFCLQYFEKNQAALSQDLQQDFQNNRQNTNKPATLNYVYSKLLLLIFRQKCQQWCEEGVTPLPSFCWQYLDKIQTVLAEGLLKDFQSNRYNTNKPPRSDYEISATLSLLILRQKCQQWYEEGVIPLPSFCLRYLILFEDLLEDDDDE